MRLASKVDYPKSQAVGQIFSVDFFRIRESRRAGINLLALRPKPVSCCYGLDGPFLRVQVREAVVTVLLAAIQFLDIVTLDYPF